LSLLWETPHFSNDAFLIVFFYAIFVVCYIEIDSNKNTERKCIIENRLYFTFVVYKILIFHT